MTRSSDDKSEIAPNAASQNGSPPPEKKKPDFVKRGPFNAALRKSQFPWLAKMAAEGRLSEEQLTFCQEHIEDFREIVKEIRTEQPGSDIYR